MTKIPTELLANWALLRQIWYMNFFPKCKVTSYKVPSWKIATISGGIPGKPIVLVRSYDQKTVSIAYSDINNKFLSESNYIEEAKKQNYQFIKKDSQYLVFSPIEFDS